jgi:predicted MPP superfamily phosphohydrolase
MLTTHAPRVERVGHAIGRGPLTIVQVSDVHAGTRWVRRLFERAVAELPSEADLVVVTGDSVLHDDPDDAAFVARSLADAVKARIGRFAVLGNHDYGVTGRPGRETPADLALGDAAAARLGAEGFTVLRNRWTLAQPGLVVAGADDVGAKQIDPDATLRGAPEDALRILLVHNPDGAHWILARHRADVVLCGHTHAGQIRLPGLPPPIVNLRMKRYWRGAYRVRGASMYVSRGFGTTHLHLRIWSRPELTVHEIS